MAGKCAAITRNGQPCKGLVREGNDYCPAHDPSRAGERKKAASKAGKSKPAGREIAEAKRLLNGIVGSVLRGELKTSQGAVAVQAINAKRGLLELERRIKEQDEILERLERLEETHGVASQAGGRRWG